MENEPFNADPIVVGNWKRMLKVQKKTSCVVYATQINFPEGFSVETGHGRAAGKPGDYLVIGPAGDKYPCDKDVFESTYDVVGSGCEWQAGNGKIEYDEYNCVLRADGRVLAMIAHWTGPSVGRRIALAWNHYQESYVPERKSEDAGVPRFTLDASGVIRDSETGLEWLVGPDRDTDYVMAEKWVASLSGVSGGGWRMPTVAELRTLYQPGVGSYNIDPAFRTTGWWVWGEPRDESSAWNFNFNNGSENWDDRDHSNYGDRVFAVRGVPF